MVKEQKPEYIYRNFEMEKYLKVASNERLEEIKNLQKIATEKDFTKKVRSIVEWLPRLYETPYLCCRFEKENLLFEDLGSFETEARIFDKGNLVFESFSTPRNPKKNYHYHEVKFYNPNSFLERKIEHLYKVSLVVKKEWDNLWKTRKDLVEASNYLERLN